MPCATISTAAHTSTVHRDVNSGKGAKVFELGLVFRIIKFGFHVGFLNQAQPSFSSKKSEGGGSFSWLDQI